MEGDTMDSALPEIQAKLSDISDILKNLPKALQAQALGDIENLAINIKGKLVKSEETSDEQFLQDSTCVSIGSIGVSSSDICEDVSTVKLGDTDSLNLCIQEPHSTITEEYSDVSKRDTEQSLDTSELVSEQKNGDEISNQLKEISPIPQEESVLGETEEINIKTEQGAEMEKDSTEAEMGIDSATSAISAAATDVIVTDIKMGKKKEKREKCLVCRKKFKDKSTLRDHMQSLHKIKIDLNNSKKNDTLNDRKNRNVEQSIKKESIKKSQLYQQNLSEVIAADPTMNIQVKTEKELKKEKDPEESYKCTVCGKVLSREIGLKQHMSRFHAAELPTTCDICNKTYNTPKHLLSHKRIVHGSKRFYCDQCSYSTKHTLDLKRHIIRFHRSIMEYPYECEICSKRFVTTTTLRKHSEVHKEDRPVQNCKYEGCKFKTRSTMSMTIHIRNKHLGLQKYFECEFCGKKLGAKSTYETHVRRHKGQYIFRCIKCSAAFPCRTQLSAHFKTHGEKTEECTVCGKKFSSKSKVTRHMMVHSGEKKYACPWCQYRCNLDSNLRKHCIARHNIEHPPKRRPVVRLEYLGQEDDLPKNTSNDYDKNKYKKVVPNILRKQQKVELMLSRSEDGTMDTDGIIKFLESQGFYGQQSVQVEVGGQTFMINCNKKTGVKTEDKPLHGTLAEDDNDEDDDDDMDTNDNNNDSEISFTVNTSNIMKYSRLTDLSPVKYNIDSSTHNNTVPQITLDVQEHNSVSDITLPALKMENTVTATAAAAAQNIQLSSTGGIDNIDGECILSEETLQQITMMGDSSTVLVIQQPDGTYQVQHNPQTASDNNQPVPDIDINKSTVDVPLEQYEITVGKSNSNSITDGFGTDEVVDDNIVSDNSYDVVYTDVKDGGGFEISTLDSDGNVILTPASIATIEEFPQDTSQQMLVVNNDQI